MIKFLGKIEGDEPLLGLALSEQDLRRLLGGEPLSLPVGDLGAELRVVGDPPRRGGRRGAVLLFRANENEVEARFRAFDVQVRHRPAPERAFTVHRSG